ncbi:MAG: 2'-5' RNA ligase family protein [Chitinophagaceae bacterium]
MKHIMSLPGYRENEYLLVLKPHEELSNQIKMIKEKFAKDFEAPMAIWTKPQIPLVKFFQYEMMEERIFNQFKNIGIGINPFKVELSNFGSFPTHTIYINVTTKLPIQVLIKQLKSSQQLLKHKDVKPHFIEESHLTICQRLIPWQYEKAWLVYSHEHYTGRFIADSMQLLKRPAGEKGYKPVQNFDFLNLPVSTKQGDLF